MACVATRVGGIVLGGGQSRRMGTAKEWLPCGREYLLQRVVRIVASVVQPIVVAVRRGQALPPLPDDVLRAYDAIAGGGPLVGLAAGFDALADRCTAAFVTSCDQPLLKAARVRQVLRRPGGHGLRSAGGRSESRFPV